MASTAFGPKGFTTDDIPDLSGKTYAITGGNSGIGLEAARHMGRRGARILLLCRSMDKAGIAAADLRKSAPQGHYETIPLDLSRLTSVRGAAEAISSQHEKLDGLINNAGLMFVPKRTLTEDGFEMHFGVNVLGHFALNALLADLVENADGRFVSVSSIAHHYAKGLPFDDLSLTSGYSPMKAYAISKLANLIYAFELQRRLAAQGKKAISVACHPGYSATNLQSTAPGPIATLLMKPMNAFLAQPATAGALPTVLAATSPDAVAAGFYGPTGARQFKGPVAVVPAKPWALDESAGTQLWEAAETLTGEHWLTGA